MDDTSNADHSAPAPAESSVVHLLLVDDEEDERRTFGKLLAKCGFTVTAVAGVKEALERCLHFPPDLILADWCLGKGCTGLDLLKVLRSQEATKDIPFIMMSAIKRGVEAEAEVRRHGGALFLTKTEVQDKALRSFERHARSMVLARRQPAGQTQAVGLDQESRPRLVGGVMVIDDDPETHELVRFTLERRYGPVRCCDCGTDGFLQASDRRPDLVLLDLAMIGMNGVEACRLFKGHAKTKDIPILIMTAMPNEADVLKDAMAQLGANDFLRKPFGENELIRHVERLLRESSPGAAPQETSLPAQGETLERGRIRADTASRKVWVDGLPIRGRLGPKGFELLCVLLRHPGPVSRERLRAKVWPGSENGQIVEVNIHRLRQSLGLASEEGIVSVPGGYLLTG
ncbi:MAG: response regulator transcription factor [Elusimicrobia bacterium]|nr:response regulator transcription factor [Elusimicrobiota bacterium]